MAALTYADVAPIDIALLTASHDVAKYLLKCRHLHVFLGRGRVLFAPHSYREDVSVNWSLPPLTVIFTLSGEVMKKAPRAVVLFPLAAEYTVRTVVASTR